MTQSPFPTNNIRSILRHRHEAEEEAIAARDRAAEERQERLARGRIANHEAQVAAQQQRHAEGLARAAFSRETEQAVTEARAQLDQAVRAQELETATTAATRLSALESVNAAIARNRSQQPMSLPLGQI